MGALQAGILRALIARGLQPSRIVGTSVGALNGAFLAVHPGEEGLERLAQTWRALENERYIRANPVRVAYRLASRQRCLFSSDFLRELIAEHTVEDDFAAARVPLHVTATNLATGKKRVFSEGPLSQAVLASAAIPGVFAPIEIDGESYIDGGVVAHLDLDTAVDEGSKEILAIDLSHCFEEPEPRSAIGVISRTVDIVLARSRRARHSPAPAQGADYADPARDPRRPRRRRPQPGDAIAGAGRNAGRAVRGTVLR